MEVLTHPMSHLRSMDSMRSGMSDSDFDPAVFGNQMMGFGGAGTKKIQNNGHESSGSKLPMQAPHSGKPAKKLCEDMDCLDALRFSAAQAAPHGLFSDFGSDSTESSLFAHTAPILHLPAHAANFVGKTAVLLDVTSTVDACKVTNKALHIIRTLRPEAEIMMLHDDDVDCAVASVRIGASCAFTMWPVMVESGAFSALEFQRNCSDMAAFSAVFHGVRDALLEDPSVNVRMEKETAMETKLQELSLDLSWLPAVDATDAETETGALTEEESEDEEDSYLGEGIPAEDLDERDMFSDDDF